MTERTRTEILKIAGSEYVKLLIVLWGNSITNIDRDTVWKLALENALGLDRRSA